MNWISERPHSKYVELRLPTCTSIGAMVLEWSHNVNNQNHLQGAYDDCQSMNESLKLEINFSEISNGLGNFSVSNCSCFLFSCIFNPLSCKVLNVHLKHLYIGLLSLAWLLSLAYIHINIHTSSADMFFMYHTIKD